MSRVLLPKLSELTKENAFIRQLYLDSQCNETVDPLWVGVAVILNDGADLFIRKHFENACWYSLYKATITDGGLDGRIGLITQYENQQHVEVMKSIYGSRVPERPWVRISCHLADQNNICDISSVVLDARLCTTIPHSIFVAAKEHVLEQENQRNSIFNEFFK